MMALELPAPGLGRGRLAVNLDEIDPLAQKIVVFRHFGQGFVQPHDVARELKSFGAERCAHQSESSIALRCRHLRKANSLAGIEVLVHPLAPFDVVDWIHGSGELQWSERSDEPLSRVAHWLCRDACRLDLKNSLKDIAVGRDPLERREPFILILLTHPAIKLRSFRRSL